jgi:hypothetical protein
MSTTRELRKQIIEVTAHNSVTFKHDWLRISHARGDFLAN